MLQRKRQERHFPASFLYFVNYAKIHTRPSFFSFLDVTFSSIKKKQTTYYGFPPESIPDPISLVLIQGDSDEVTALTKNGHDHIWLVMSSPLRPSAYMVGDSQPCK